MLRFIFLFVLFCLVSQPVHAALIWYANMNQGTGTTVTPNVGAQTCTFTNSPTWTTGKFGSGIDFDGAGDADYLQCGTSHIVTTDDWTIAAWIKLESSGGTRVIVQNGDNGSAAFSGAVFYATSGDKLACTIYVGTNSASTATSTASLDETGAVWTHVACRKSGTTLTTWINGVEDGSATPSSATMDYAGDDVEFNVGANQAAVQNFLGQIDEVRLYDSVENPAVIFAIDPTVKARQAIIIQ